jgi:hypothetical protein
MKFANRLLLLTKFPQSPLSPYRSPFLCAPKKWGKIGWFLLVVYRFRSISTSTSPTATIAIIMPTVAGIK